MVKSSLSVDKNSAIPKFYNGASLLDQVNGMCDGVYFEVQVEPSESQIHNHSMVVLKDQLKQLNKLQQDYNDLIQKANDTLQQLRNEYENKGHEITLVKRTVATKIKLEPKIEYTLTPTLVPKLELENPPKTVNHLEKKNKFKANIMKRIKRICDDILFEIFADSRRFKSNKEKELVFELKEIKSCYKPYETGNDKGEHLTKSNQEVVCETTQF